MLKKSKILTPKLRRALAQIPYLPKALALVWKSAPGLTIAWGISLAIQGLLPVATVYLSRLLIDSLVATTAASGNQESMRYFLITAVLMAGVLLLTELLEITLNWVRNAQAEFVEDYITALVHKQSMAADLGFYESPEYHDHLGQARENANTAPLELLESIGGLVQNSITLLAMATVLIPYGIWLPLVLFASILPVLYVVLHYHRYYHRWWEKTTADRRWTDYYDFMLTNDQVAAEMRLFNLGNHFQSAYQSLRHRLRKQHLGMIKNQSLALLWSKLIAMVVSGMALAWMLWRTLQGFLTLGDLALFYQAFHKGQGLMRSLLENVGQIYSNSLFLEHLFKFLELQPQIVNPPQPLAIPTNLNRGIRFEDVTFGYPGSQRLALKNFNLTIPAGKTIAIVGDNGAGKSTLLKLICRFYDPQMGSIQLDGVDLRSFSVEQLRRNISVLFQEPVQYHATAGENIILGDLTSNPTQSEIEAAACGAGSHEVIARLPQAYNTMLGKEFIDGTDLSGGEWQRIALARAFLRQAPIILLDEPTSAMDSWAEAKWLDRFQELFQGRTAIIITHRFTTAMRADWIHLMRNGQIVESGSHEQLINQGGFYAESWAAQMQNRTQQINDCRV